MLVQSPLWSVTIPSLITASVMTVSFMPQPISVSFPYNFFLTGLHFQCPGLDAVWQTAVKTQTRQKWLSLIIPSGLIAISNSFKTALSFTVSFLMLPKLSFMLFVLSQYAHINYRNSLLARCHQKLICKLQKFENNTAYLICRSSGLDSISLIPLLYTGFLSNPMFNPKFFLPLSHWTTKPLHVSLISSSCMFHLTNSACLPILDFFVFHLLISSVLVNTPSVKHHYTGTVCPTFSNILLPQHHLSLPSSTTFSPLNTE